MFRKDGWYRSILYAPAHRDNLEQVFANTPADVVMLDLEDGVPLADKPAARVKATALAKQDWPPLAALRVNKADSGMIPEDLECFGPGIGAVILPKAERAADLQDIDRRLTEKEKALGIEVGRTKIIGLVESCFGALEAANLARATPRLLTLGIGASDFMADIGSPVSRATLDPEALSLPRRMLVLAARAAGLSGPFDGGQFPPGRPGWGEACDMVRRIGFQGKVCFDDAQAAEANAVFSAREGEALKL
ncbi:MAG: aldolase/citrate lyase family protein [Oceanibaculum nanhaiense]|uniref:HpcH/HpaI aldolase/citrate lyase family protein n=1 Tax=Oceanibaculum nanhaiense TaxID=1909734 RepID=UPI0032EFEC75